MEENGPGCFFTVGGKYPGTVLLCSKYTGTNELIIESLSNTLDVIR